MFPWPQLFLLHLHLHLHIFFSCFRLTFTLFYLHSVNCWFVWTVFSLFFLPCLEPGPGVGVHHLHGPEEPGLRHRIYGDRGPCLPWDGGKISVWKWENMWEDVFVFADDVTVFVTLLFTPLILTPQCHWAESRTYRWLIRPLIRWKCAGNLLWEMSAATKFCTPLSLEVKSERYDRVSNYQL